MAAEAARRRHPVRRTLLVLLGLAVLVGVALVLLALPFRGVQGDAEAARDDLQVAADALRAGDVSTAQVHVESARGHVDRARGATDGIGGDVWQFVPVAGAGVRDVRNLVAALDDATSIAEIGVEVYPQVLGDQAGALVEGESVDLDVLDDILTAGRAATEHAHHAIAALDQVDGDAPVVGASVASARDAALAELEPLNDQLDQAEPFLDVLPGLLGEEREMKYLVAILNPAELRYSGGATLALATVRIKDGKSAFRDIGTLAEAKDADRALYWKKVKGNTFHPRGKARLQNATWSPYWSTSGEELLRAWAKVTKEEFDGVIAIDIPAIASLFNVTGPLDVGEYGTLDATNLTQTLVGSYDTYNDIFERRALNDTLIPIFRDKLFAGGKFVEKFQTLGEAAEGRHFAVYMRDSEAQRIVEELGVTGDLSDTDHDYLGVFTQNTNVAKSDYWQQRTVSSDVTLHEDGSARVALTVEVSNTSAPYPYDTPDPGFGYFTRINESAVATFFPKDVKIRSTTVDGKPEDPFLRHVGDRPYFYRTVTLDPGESATLEVVYDVPRAADVEDGALTYRLDVDPQGMVTPELVDVTVHVPKGYAVRDLPADWTRTDRSTARWVEDGLADSPRWEIQAARLG